MPENGLKFIHYSHTITCSFLIAVYIIIGGVDGDVYGQVAIIASTNAELFERMVAVCITEPRYHDKKVGFAGVSNVSSCTAPSHCGDESTS